MQPCTSCIANKLDCVLQTENGGYLKACGPCRAASTRYGRDPKPHNPIGCSFKTLSYFPPRTQRNPRLHGRTPQPSYNLGSAATSGTFLISTTPADISQSPSESSVSYCASNGQAQSLPGFQSFERPALLESDMLSRAEKLLSSVREFEFAFVFAI